MAEHDDELGFFFCENCGRVHKENVPYEKLAEECSHCHFDTWIWEPNEAAESNVETRTIHATITNKGRMEPADTTPDHEYATVRADRLEALERLYECAKRRDARENTLTNSYDEALAANAELNKIQEEIEVALAEIERMEAEEK